MPEPNLAGRSETDLIAWAIPLIADGCYSIDTEEGRNELTVYDYETVSLEFMEGALLYKRQKQQIDALKRCKESCNPENILRCCVAYLGPILGPNIAQQIVVPEYWRLVTGISNRDGFSCAQPIKPSSVSESGSVRNV